LVNAGVPADTAWTGNGVRVSNGVGAENQPTLLRSGAGGTFVVWWDDRDGSLSVHAQHLSSTGSPTSGWPAEGLKIADGTGSGFQEYPQLVPDGSGGAVVAWMDTRGSGGPSLDNIYLQRIDTAGNPLWLQAGVAAMALGTAYSCFGVASDGAGGVFLAWEDGRESPGRSPYRAYAQHLDASGQRLWGANGVPLSVETGDDQFCPRVVPDDAGGLIASWTDLRRFAVSGMRDIYAQRLDASGTRLWGDSALAACIGTSSGGATEMVSDDAGGAIIESCCTATGGSVVQRFGPTGTRLWGASGVPISGCGGIAPDGSGGVIAAWGVPAAHEVRAERVNASGTALWGSPVVCSGATPDVYPFLRRHSIAPDGAGGAIIAWGDTRSGPGMFPRLEYADVYAQRVTADGAVAPGWPTAGRAICTLDSLQGLVATVPDGEGGAVIAWEDDRGLRRNVYAARVTADGIVATTLSLVSAVAVPGEVRLRWSGSEVLTAMLYRCVGSRWLAITGLLPDGHGLIEYVDTDVEAGKRYGYRLGVREGGLERFYGETWVDVPSVLQLALETPYPNPGDADFLVAFALPTDQPAVIELRDVAGRRIVVREVGDLGPGRHTIRLRPEIPLRPAVYFLRLRQGGSSVAAKLTIRS